MAKICSWHQTFFEQMSQDFIRIAVIITGILEEGLRKGVFI